MNSPASRALMWAGGMFLVQVGAALATGFGEFGIQVMAPVSALIIGAKVFITESDRRSEY